MDSLTGFVFLLDLKSEHEPSFIVSVLVLNYYIYIFSVFIVFVLWDPRET